MSEYWKSFTVVESGQEHLGGNLRYGDTRSITPAFWRYLIDRFSVRSVLDIGAGEGHASSFFHRLGIVSHGIDGLARNVKNARFPLALHEFAHGPYIYPCDLTYCVEVAEHIEEKHIDNLLVTLSNAPVIAMTHGLPGQPGHFHVNCQPTEYWIEKLDLYGYSLSIDNEWFKETAAREDRDCYFAKSGLVFLRR